MATTINAGRVAMVPKGSWDSTTAYSRLDVVMHNGSSWICITDSTGNEPVSGSTYWQLAAEGVDASNYYTKAQCDSVFAAKGGDLTHDFSASNVHISNWNLASRGSGFAMTRSDNVDIIFPTPAAGGSTVAYLSNLTGFAAKNGSTNEYFVASTFSVTASDLDSSIQIGANGIDRLINIQTQPQQVPLTFPAQGGTLALTSDIIKRTYVDNSADASVELAVTTYNDLGTLSAWKTITLPANYDRADEFVFRFVCNDASLTPTLPSGVVMADKFEWSEMAVGVVFQVSIFDGEAAYLVLTPNT